MTDSLDGAAGEGEGGRMEGVGILTPEERALLLQIAGEAIRWGLEAQRPMEVDPEEYSQALRAEGAVFVTLRRGGQLRGCVGSIEPRRSLVEDVARNAHAAAFLDPRFPGLRPEEMEDLELHVSILSPLDPLQVRGRDELIRRLRPGVDGLLLEDPPHRSTFLPQVWDSLPDPERFLSELLLKAGLPADHWSSTLTFHRYSVTEI